MTEVYVIRHAEAEGNYYLRAMGSFDSDLTRLGRQQLKYLAKRFEGVRLDAIYASTLYRSQETARAVAAVSGMPVRIEPEIREIHVGVWEDRPWGNLTREYPEMMRRYNSDPMRWHVEGCESSRHVQERMLRAIKDLARRHDGGAVAAVSHGCAIRLLLAGIRGIPSEEMRWSLHSDNTAVTLLRIEGDDVEIVYEGDSSHLPLEYSRFARQKWWTEEGAEHPEPYLRPWDPEKDAELYVSLYRDAWACAHGNAPFDPVPYLGRARARSMKDPMSVVVAVYGEKPGGIIELQDASETDPGASHIAFLALTREFRGKGNSPVLLGEAISRCRRLGKDRMRLCVAPENQNAREYYQHMGFQPVGTAPGALGDLTVMERSVAF